MLHIGANHLGNILDVPNRVIKLIQEVDYVVIEFEDHFLNDIKKLNISKPNYLIYKDDNVFFNSILQLLKQDKSILILNEMGYPGIADPGHKLINLAIKNNIPINIIPGPSIGPVALAASGFYGIGNVLVETFDKSNEDVIKIISGLKYLKYPIIILDHKENILNIIKICKNILSDKEVCLCINLGWDSNQKIIKTNYDNIIDIMENTPLENLFGPFIDRPVVTLVLGNN